MAAHKDAIIEVAAVGGAILAGIACTAATAGAGAVACMVGAGALINLAKDSAQGDVHSIGDALGSVGTGALSGVVGGAGGAVAAKIGTAVASKVGAGLGGRLVTEAAENGVDEVFNQVATTGRVDTRSALMGIVPGASLLNRKNKGGGGSSGGLPSAVGLVGLSAGGGGGGGCDTSRRKPGGKHSFESSTRVLMADGSLRPIADVNVGDAVVATDPVTDTSAAKQVTQLHGNVDRELSDVSVVNRDGVASTVRTTQNHPFWSETDREWTDAKDLTAGERLKVEGEGTVVVASVRSYVGVEEMRDLTVADTHTYYVVAGKTSVLVHNMNCDEDFIENDRGDRLYGPFRREASPTQSDDVASRMESSGELWGNPARQSLPEPMAQAYRGGLAPGQRGVEFYTPVKPLSPRNSPPGEARWPAGLPGVRQEEGYAKIPIIVVRNTRK